MPNGFVAINSSQLARLFVFDFDLYFLTTRRLLIGANISYNLYKINDALRITVQI